MKILLLDDDKDRIQDIQELAHDYNAEVIMSFSLDDAETRIKESHFDLVIVDLVVPPKYNNRTLSKVAGLEFIKFIYESLESIYMPYGVLAVSIHLDELDYLDQLRLYPVPLIDTTAENWKGNIRTVIDNYCSRINSVDVAIITAVDVEFKAMYDESWAKDLDCGTLTFYRKRIKTNSGAITAILFQSENKGLLSASFAMSQLFKYYSPKKVFMIGIAAGNSKRTSLGDIIVAKESCDYSIGAVKDDKGELEFESEPSLLRASDNMSNIFRSYSLNERLQYDLRSKVNMDDYNSDIKIHLGLMASGPLVVKSIQLKEKFIIPFNRNYFGIDMETYAVYYSCIKNGCKDFMSIKSVSDFADKDKDKDYQKYCSKLSAELLKYYIHNEM